jgi:hypothetical protein
MMLASFGSDECMTDSISITDETVSKLIKVEKLVHDFENVEFRTFTRSAVSAQCPWAVWRPVSSSPDRSLPSPPWDSLLR